MAFAVAVVTVDVGLGAAELQGTVHEVFAVQFADGAAGFIDAAHGDKGEAFGALSAVVDDDFSIADGTNTVEQLKEIALCGVIGEVADIEPLSGDAGGVNGAELFFRTFSTRLAVVVASFGNNGGVAGGSPAFAGFTGGSWFAQKTEGDEAQELLQGSLFGCSVGSERRAGTAVRGVA